LVLKGDGSEDIAGMNAIDINPARQLLAFGVDGNGSVANCGTLVQDRAWATPSAEKFIVSIHNNRNGRSSRSFSVISLASRADGLSYAVGTSTGHTHLCDIHTSRNFALKDLGYGLPVIQAVKNVHWIDGGGKMTGAGLVLSANKKVIEIWDRNSSSGNFASVTPSYPINDVHHVPESGMLILANVVIK